MVSFSRRALLAASAAGGLLAGAAARVKAQTFGNPDLPPQGAINAQNPRSLNDPGPQNPALASQFPSAVSPPATDVGGLPQNWASFNNASKRIQNGGWARQVTQADFALSEAISGVNMRLTAGGIRELHWHLAGEWAYMSYGNCRVTVVRRAEPHVRLRRQGRRHLVLPGRPAAFPARHRLGRLRVHHRLRRRQGERVQHAAGHRLAGPHPARNPGGKFRHSGRQLYPRSRCKIAGFSRVGCPAICRSIRRPCAAPTARRPIPSHSPWPG